MAEEDVRVQYGQAERSVSLVRVPCLDDGGPSRRRMGRIASAIIHFGVTGPWWSGTAVAHLKTLMHAKVVTKIA